MKFFLICISMFLLACSEEQQPQTISLEELAGETGAEEFVIDSATTDKTNLPSNVLRFIDGQLGLYDTARLYDDTHPIDRFGYSTCKKLGFYRDVAENKMALEHPAASLYYYSFADTSATKNAFYNWLDCFGPGCISVSLNENIDKAELSPMTALVYDTCIVTLEHSGLARELQDSLLAGFGKDYNYRIDVSHKGALKWKSAK